MKLQSGTSVPIETRDIVIRHNRRNGVMHSRIEFATVTKRYAQKRDVRSRLRPDVPWDTMRHRRRRIATP
jgi:hypothetical protein